MENRDLPLSRRISERVFEPGGLSWIKVGGIEHEEFDQAIALLQPVIRRAAHVEERIPALILASGAYIVIAQDSVETHAIFQQARKRRLKVF